MEKINFTFTLTEKQLEEKKKKVALLLQNPIVQKWMQKYHVDDSFIFDHSGKFQDYAEVMEKCENCRGLDFCTQPTKGRRLELYMDHILLNHLVNCPYRKKSDEQFAHMKNYVTMHMPQDYLLIDLARLDISKESESYKNIVLQVLKIMMDENTAKGVYLWGKPGAGKTYLAAGMSNYYTKHGKRVAFVNVPKLIADLKMMFQDANLMEHTLHQIRSCDILVLDDIGGESVTAWSRDDILLPILDARMEKNRLTIFTSNYSMKELKEKFASGNGKMMEPVAAERLLERIKALACEFFVKGNTRRQ